jgi:hypothetical protein
VPCYRGGKNVADIPFNRFLGLQPEGASVTLPEAADSLNHLGTVLAPPRLATHAHPSACALCPT